MTSYRGWRHAGEHELRDGIAQILECEHGESWAVSTDALDVRVTELIDACRHSAGR